MKKILVIYGKSSTGKTTTINDIFIKLSPNGTNIIEPKTQIGGDSKDFTVVLSYNNQSIGILSMGDKQGDVDDFINNHKYCDVILIAYNERFKTIKTSLLQYADLIYKFNKIAANDTDNAKVRQDVISKI